MAKDEKRQREEEQRTVNDSKDGKKDKDEEKNEQ